MKSLAIRVPTLTAAGESLPGGHTYLMLPPSITLRDLITEKTRAELRKARAAGYAQSTLADLVEGEIVDDDGSFWLHAPHADAIALRNTVNAFERGVFVVAVNGHAVEDPGTMIHIGRATQIAFIITAAVFAAAAPPHVPASVAVAAQ